MAVLRRVLLLAVVVYCDQVYSWASQYTEGVHAIVVLVYKRLYYQTQC
jgi:hypothetical protein